MLFIAGIAIAAAASLVLLSAIIVTGTTPTDWYGIGAVPTAEPIVIEAPTPAPTFTPTPEPPLVQSLPTHTLEPTATPVPIVPKEDNMCLVWDDIRVERVEWISPGVEYRVVIDILAVSMTEAPEGAPDMHYGSGTIVLEQGQKVLISVFKYDGPFEIGTTYDLRVTWWQTIPPIGGTDIYGVHDVIDAWPSRPKEDLQGGTDASSA